MQWADVAPNAEVQERQTSATGRPLLSYDLSSSCAKLELLPGTAIVPDSGGDPTALPDLLDQVDGPVDRFLAEGAYDGEPTSDLLAARFGSTIEVTIPPPGNAIPSPNAANDPTARDGHIAEIESHGRMAWQKATGYNQRSRGETLMGRWKAVIGPKLKARTFESQKTEARIGVRVLNRMTGLGSPDFEHAA